MNTEQFMQDFNPKKEGTFNTNVELRVYDTAQKKFALVREIPVNKTSSFRLPGKKFNNTLQYRYRVRNENGEWEVATPYLPVCTTTISQAMGKLSDFSSSAPPLHLLDEASPSELKYLTRNLLAKFYNYILNPPTENKVEHCRQYLRTFPSSLLKKHFEIAYFHALSYVVSRATSDYITHQRDFRPEELAQGIFDEYKNEYPHATNAGSKAGLHVGAGHLWSIGHRNNAYSHYQAALDYGTEALDLFLLVDGITTYFESVPKTSAPEILSIDGHRRPTEHRTVCIAADERYWRAYATQWAHYSELFRGISFEFCVVCQSKHSAESFAANFGELKRAIAVSMGKPHEANVHISAVLNDQDDKTYYACARFFVAQDLLLQTESDVLCLDIDQYVLGDLEEFFAETESGINSVGLQLAKGLYKYLPGRSHLAGYVYFKNSESSERFLDDVVSYVNYGLTKPRSWMLDQNALRFAAEKSKYSLLNVDRSGTFSHSNKIRLKAKRAVVRTGSTKK
ncbi:hypothetical protein ACUY2X_12905 [Corynebacterium minutissimum]